jgi:hypothetical protein
MPGNEGRGDGRSALCRPHSLMDDWRLRIFDFGLNPARVVKSGRPCLTGGRRLHRGRGGSAPQKDEDGRGSPSGVNRADGREGRLCGSRLHRGRGGSAPQKDEDGRLPPSGVTGRTAGKDRSAGRRLRARAPSSRTTPPGGRPGTTETMKEADNRSATASPRGGVESSVIGTRSTATRVNTIRRRTRTSLRASGEVGLPGCSGSAAHVPGHGGTRVVSRVVGGSRSGRGCAGEDGRPAGAGSRKRLPAGVRAAIRARASRGRSKAGKTGTMERSRVTTGGAKGGRKVERQGP